MLSNHVLPSPSDQASTRCSAAFGLAQVIPYATLTVASAVRAMTKRAAEVHDGDKLCLLYTCPCGYTIKGVEFTGGSRRAFEDATEDAMERLQKHAMLLQRDAAFCRNTYLGKHATTEVPNCEGTPIFDGVYGDIPFCHYIIPERKRVARDSSSSSAVAAAPPPAVKASPPPAPGPTSSDAKFVSKLALLKRGQVSHGGGSRHVEACHCCDREE